MRTCQVLIMACGTSTPNEESKAHISRLWKFANLSHISAYLAMEKKRGVAHTPYTLEGFVKPVCLSFGKEKHGPNTHTRVRMDVRTDLRIHARALTNK